MSSEWLVERYFKDRGDPGSEEFWHECSSPCGDYCRVDPMWKACPYFEEKIDV